MSAAKKGMKKSTYLIIWTLVIALLCSAVGVVNYEALYWDSALTLYFGEVGVKNVSTVTFDTDDHAQVANLIVAEGAVLLKNEKNALPMCALCRGLISAQGDFPALRYGGFAATRGCTPCAASRLSLHTHKNSTPAVGVCTIFAGFIILSGR